MAKRRKDQKFLDWLSFQRSWLDGNFSEYVGGVGKNIPCHNRRAGEAGTAYKPLWRAVAMTFAQHKVQSEQGELACIMQFAPRLLSANPTVQEAKSLFDHAANHSLARWRDECPTNR